MIHQQIFSEAAESVPAARHFALAALAELPDDFVATAALLVSELATNAVRHGSTPFALSIDVANDYVLVQVADNGQGGAMVRNPAPTEPSGRGLQVVARLSDEWGILPASTSWANTVWFRLHRTRAITAS